MRQQQPSKIEQLVLELCPNGVVYTELSEVAHYSKQRINASKLDSTNYVGVDNLLQNKQGKTISSYVPKLGKLTQFNVGNILIGNIRPYLKKIWLSDCLGGTNGDVLVIQIIDKQKLSSEFLYYVLSSDNFFNFDMKFAKGAKMPRGNKDSILKYLVPLPPVAIQEAIVKTLSTFIELEAGLEAELGAELEARQKQYEHYRDELLKIENSTDAKRVRFGDIAKIVRGGSPRPISSYITNDENGVNWIKIGDTESGGKYITHTGQKIKPSGVAKSRFVKKGDFVLSNSMSFGRPYILKIDGCIHDGWLAISDFDKTYHSDYLYHLLSSNLINRMMAQKASKGTVKNLNAEIVKLLILPAPSLADQRRIATLLDKFDTLTNDISEGLPAELAARRQQYEYYRNKLLTFKEYVG